MKGHNAPGLTEREIRHAFSHPIGTERIEDLARGKGEVVILFDDLTRPTRAAEIIPHVLEELARAGVRDEQIRFIAALGAHGALNRLGWAKKLGEAVLSRFPVYNHNPYENCIFLGKTSRGIPISINAEVMKCDLKIGLGCILPHRLTGFGGGGKIILPGVASIDTIEATHSLEKEAFASQLDTIAQMGRFEENPMRPEVEEAAQMAQLDVKIDLLVGYRRETVGIFVGDPIAEHHYGVERAKEHYATLGTQGADIVVANAYSKAGEAFVAVLGATKVLKDEGGDLVIISTTPEGQVTHYLSRSFGKSIGGRLWRAKTALPSKVDRLIMLTPFPDRTAADWLAPADSIVWCETWDEVLKHLVIGHGSGTKVAVIPDATIQYFPAS